MVDIQTSLIQAVLCDSILHARYHAGRQTITIIKEEGSNEEDRQGVDNMLMFTKARMQLDSSERKPVIKGYPSQVRESDMI